MKWSPLGKLLYQEILKTAKLRNSNIYSLTNASLLVNTDNNMPFSGHFDIFTIKNISWLKPVTM